MPCLVWHKTSVCYRVKQNHAVNEIISQLKISFRNLHAIEAPNYLCLFLVHLKSNEKRFVIFVVPCNKLVSILRPSSHLIEDHGRRLGGSKADPLPSLTAIIIAYSDEKISQMNLPPPPLYLRKSIHFSAVLSHTAPALASTPRLYDFPHSNLMS